MVEKHKVFEESENGDTRVHPMHFRMMVHEISTVMNQLPHPQRQFTDNSKKGFSKESVFAQCLQHLGLTINTLINANTEMMSKTANERPELPYDDIEGLIRKVREKTQNGPLKQVKQASALLYPAVTTSVVPDSPTTMRKKKLAHERSRQNASLTTSGFDSEIEMFFNKPTVLLSKGDVPSNFNAQSSMSQARPDEKAASMYAHSQSSQAHAEDYKESEQHNLHSTQISHERHKKSMTGYESQ